MSYCKVANKHPSFNRKRRRRKKKTKKLNNEFAENIYDDVEPSCMTRILVTAGSPVLPLANLAASSFFPHGTRMFEAFRLNTVQLQREISFRTCNFNKRQHVTETESNSQFLRGLFSSYKQLEPRIAILSERQVNS